MSVLFSLLHNYFYYAPYEGKGHININMPDITGQPVVPTI